MALIRPRLNDYHGLAFTQEQADFAIPLLDDDIPLYVDPFLLWKSPSQQDQALHTAIISSFNHLGRQFRIGKKEYAISALVDLSECQEVGLGSARNKRGKRIGEKTADSILTSFETIPQLGDHGIGHIEEIQLLADQVSKDRISDISCNLMKSFLIDYTIEKCEKHAIPSKPVNLRVFNYQTKEFNQEDVPLPVNPMNDAPILLVPKRWLRYSSWINYEDYFSSSFVKDDQRTQGRVALLNYNRQNYGIVQSYVAAKERAQSDCRNDPLFKQIPVTSAKAKFRHIKALPTGKVSNADKEYEDAMCQLLASLLYPNLDFAEEQSRTDSGTLIRDLIFYNNRSMEFLADLFKLYDSRQIVVELKNVKEVEREHINQLNRYLKDEFGRFGILVTRNPLPKSIFKTTIDLWSGQRRCIIALTDADVELMVSTFESKQRLPIEVLQRAYIDFTRSCPS